MIVNIQCSRVFVNLADSYGKQYDVYDSSAGGYIWLNTRAEVMVLASRARSLGVETTETYGWVKYPVPESAHITDAVHLSRKQARELAKVLQYFAKHGSLEGFNGQSGQMRPEEASG